MKKLFTFAVLAAAICSCTNEYEAPTDSSASDNAICFEAPIVSAATRGDIVIEGDYPTGMSFCVSAKHHGKDVPQASKTWNSGTLYMDAVECSFIDNAHGWSPTPAYYWPKQGSLSFHAFSPASLKTHAHGASFGGENGGVTIGGIHSGQWYHFALQKIQLTYYIVSVHLI